MMSETKALPRKRRRPALACVECRRRKIRCDRRTPCGHCVLLKFATCVYPDTHSTIAITRNISNSSSTSPSIENPPSGRGDVAPTSRVLAVQLSDSGQSAQSLPTLGNGFASGVRSPEPRSVYSTDNYASEKNIQSLANIRNLSKASPNEHTDEVMSVLGVNVSSLGDAMFQVGGNHDVSTVKASKQINSRAIEGHWSNSNKSRFFGRSHWMNTFNMFTRRCRFKDENNDLIAGVESDEVGEILEKCRRIMRALKIERPTEIHNANLKDLIPPREIADSLVNLYFRTYESVYRILHIPSFNRDYANYWNDPQNTTPMFVAKMLLVMAIGTCFYQGIREEDLRCMAQQWVYFVRSWATLPLEKKQLSTSWIQIHCLIVLVRQTNSLDMDLGMELLWIPAGNLLRLAFSMGFHRDPKHFPNLSVFAAEMRRRIWATVLEMAVQTSMDLGMPPLITSHDFDTEPPSNINDSDISESNTAMPSPQSNRVYTQTSIQIILYKSLRTRLEIVRFINSFYSEPSYDDVLRFGEDITQACNEASRLIHSYPIYLPQPTAFQANLLDILVRRFLLEVHRPFFTRSQNDPHYYFSRKILLDTALIILFHSGAKDLPSGHDYQIIDDYERLKLVGDGFYKPIFFLAITVITVELINQLEEEIHLGIPPSAQSKSSRAPLYQAINDMVKLTTDRFKMGENNFVGAVFFSAAVALIQSMTNGLSPEDVVPKAAKLSAEQCLEILRERARKNLPPHETAVEGQPENYINIENESNESTGEPDFGFDLLMTDTNMNIGIQDGYFGLELQDPWLFTD